MSGTGKSGSPSMSGVIAGGYRSTPGRPRLLWASRSRRPHAETARHPPHIVALAEAGRRGPCGAFTAAKWGAGRSGKVAPCPETGHGTDPVFVQSQDRNAVGQKDRAGRVPDVVTKCGLAICPGSYEFQRSAQKESVPRSSPIASGPWYSMAPAASRTEHPRVKSATIWSISER